MITAIRAQQTLAMQRAFRRSISLFAQLILLGFAAGTATGAPEPGNKLQNIEFQNLPGDKVEIRLDFDEPPPAPKAYTIEQPARIEVADERGERLVELGHVALVLALDVVVMIPAAEFNVDVTDASLDQPALLHWAAGFREPPRRTFVVHGEAASAEALAARLDEHEGMLGLPLIVNRKTVDPTRPESTPVVQVESAMGAAVEVFDGARALVTPRSRFRPVKTTNDLLLLRSDLYRIGSDGAVEATTTDPEPFVDLSRAYRFVADFDARFPGGVPSMTGCSSLRVEGDTRFGADVACSGDVRITEGVDRVPDGGVLAGVLR